MKIASKVKQASFLRRENRFACLVKVGGSIETAHLANSGRLETVLTPGRTVFIAERASPARTTRYDIVTALLGETCVSVDDRVPTELINEALEEKALPQFQQYSSIRREVPRGRSRLDFLLSSRSSQCFLEVKSVTLVRRSVALFPDAPTERGRLQVESLVWAKKEGYEAAVIFVIQRDDAEGFALNDEVDPEFCRTLRLAHIKGLGIFAYKCRVKPNEIELADQVPVKL
ncbi:MAG: DNA/RNA nuclease SfsA [Dehalococcoidia bacterium]|nr:DNA/RNA nuclease SfsA [Dehalococcoidia bacterium]